MNKTYITVKNSGIAEITEKKSRFIAAMKHIESEEEAAEFIASVKKEHYNARHNVYAYLLNNGFKKYSDDGEPTRTGGFPVLEMLENEGITDCDYTHLSKVEHILKNGPFVVENISYTDMAVVDVICEKNQTDGLFSEIFETFGVSVIVEKREEIYYTL